MEENFVVPPYTNRGAQNTEQKGLRACVDWLQVTFLSIQNPYEVINILGLPEEDFKALEMGKYGYPFQLKNGYISIYYSDKVSHIHLEISGQGCRYYESKNIYDWSTLLGLILMLKVNITRLDLALDDFKGYFKIRKLYKKLEQGHARSKFKEYRFMTKGKIGTEEITGDTIYLGDPTSRLMVRIYDKYKQLISKKKEIDPKITFWNRTELQLRNERAEAAALRIAESSHTIGDLIAGTLKNYINFIDPHETDSNKSRWKVSQFWDKFLGDVEPVKLTQVAPDKTIEQVKTWFEKSITPSLATLLEAFNYDTVMLKEWLKDGKERMSERNKDMLKRFREEQAVEKYEVDLRKEVIKDKLLKPRKLKKTNPINRISL